MIEANEIIDTILDEVKRLIPKIAVTLEIDKQDFVRKGGRVCALIQVSTQALKLHPSITIEDNELKVDKLYRDKLEKSVLNYA